MKKAIAGVALITTMFGTASVALANTAQTTTTTVTAPAPTTTATTSANAPVPVVTPTPTTAPAPTVTTDAQVSTTTTLPSVSVTPDNFFYSLKLFIEKLQLTFTLDAIKKASLLQQQAQTRLAEAKVMAEAGNADLAKKAMAEANLKLEAAQAAMKKATASNKDLSKLATQVEADQVRFANGLKAMMEKAPDSVKAEVEPVLADLMVQIAATEDAAKEDKGAKEEADKVATEADLKADLAAMQPRMVLVLHAMSKASGKGLAEVVALYKANPGLGNLANSLGLKMGTVQRVAQIEWKKGHKEDEIKVDLSKLDLSKLDLTTKPVTTTAVETTAKVPTVEVKPEVKVTAPLELKIKESKDKHKKAHGDNHDDNNNHDDGDDHDGEHDQGKGNGKGKH